MQPSVMVEHFFDPATSTLSYLISDSETSQCAVIDSVLDFDPASGRTSTASADRIIDAITQKNLQLQWILETHVHADHLSAAPYLRKTLGGQIAIGGEISQVQKTFGTLFNAEPEFATDGRQFDTLLQDGSTLQIGSLTLTAIHTPGHTPACMSYAVADAVFVGDTLFMPDFGTARCDFPGGDAGTLWDSIQRILALPDATRMFTGHDYQPNDRALAFQTTVGEQRASNIHLQAGRHEFVQMRTQRDATLNMPQLILPSVQVNMRAGELPPPEDNGQRYLKIPLDML